MLSAKLVAATTALHCQGGRFVKNGFFNNFSMYEKLEKSVKTAFWHHYVGILAALIASNTHHHLMQESSIFIWGLRQIQLCMYRKIIEKSMLFYKSAAMAAMGGGGAKLILQIAYVMSSLYFNF